MRYDVNEEFEPIEDSQTQRRPRPDAFAHRHGLKILGAILGSMFALVVILQVAC